MIFIHLDVTDRELVFDITNDFIADLDTIITCTMASNAERTFIMIKPDAVHRGICGEIIKRFENKGFKLVAMKFMQASEDHLKNHYADLSSKPFFAGLVKYMAR